MWLQGWGHLWEDSQHEGQEGSAAASHPSLRYDHGARAREAVCDQALVPWPGCAHTLRQVPVWASVTPSETVERSVAATYWQDESSLSSLPTVDAQTVLGREPERGAVEPGVPSLRRPGGQGSEEHEAPGPVSAELWGPLGGLWVLKHRGKFFSQVCELEETFIS